MLTRLKSALGLSLPLIIMLLAIPIAVALEFAHGNPMLVFLFSAAGVIPLASLIGTSTEVLADTVGPRYGSLLNATMGNAAELIISIAALSAGLTDLVLASITGSILGNLLLVMGLSLLLGGIKHGVQSFNREQAGIDATLLILGVIALGIPSMFNTALEPDFFKVEGLSIGASIAMIVMYALVIVYQFTTKRDDDVDPVAQEVHHSVGWSSRYALVVLAVAVGFIALMSEVLVGAIEHVTEAFGLSEFFLGVILIPLIGNVAEHLVAVQVAIKNKMDLSIGIAVGSSLQIALFVAPLLIFISLLMGKPMQLEFTYFEIAALMAGSFIAAFVSQDGKSNWLEGAMLLIVYGILAVAFFFL